MSNHHIPSEIIEKICFALLPHEEPITRNEIIYNEEYCARWKAIRSIGLASKRCYGAALPAIYNTLDLGSNNRRWYKTLAGLIAEPAKAALVRNLLVGSGASTYPSLDTKEDWDRFHCNFLAWGEHFKLPDAVWIPFTKAIRERSHQAEKTLLLCLCTGLQMARITSTYGSDDTSMTFTMSHTFDPKCIEPDRRGRILGHVKRFLVKIPVSDFTSKFMRFSTAEAELPRGISSPRRLTISNTVIPIFSEEPVDQLSRLTSWASNVQELELAECLFTSGALGKLLTAMPSLNSLSILGNAAGPLYGRAMIATTDPPQAGRGILGSLGRRTSPGH